MRLLVGPDRFLQLNLKVLHLAVVLLVRTGA